ncbi:DUF599 family protein [Aurantimonas sp. Leaf443]|uniref:DUF599 domain-containing protein n=1 Tax=Aurantimonas sp. Leaf443 TaxID=1736378 RepID=UPI0009E77A07|nr:DUF599 family protein [Aurantimonas sp. Leaf443]
MIAIDSSEWIALGFFLAVWLAYNLVSDHTRLSKRGLTHAMNIERERWMRVMLERDLRMIDTAILTGLQQGTAFFASACIFAIGGCFALLGSADMIATIAGDLPLQPGLNKPLVEMKLLGLVVIFAYAFFKFGWAYRLFNYCTILVGAVPMRSEAQHDRAGAERAMRKAARLNQVAASHFNAGLRAIFFGLAYLGWFLGPVFLVVSTAFVVLILAHRQYLSPARKVLVE